MKPKVHQRGLRCNFVQGKTNHRLLINNDEVTRLVKYFRIWHSQQCVYTQRRKNCPCMFRHRRLGYTTQISIPCLHKASTWVHPQIPFCSNITSFAGTLPCQMELKIIYFEIYYDRFWRKMRQKKRVNKNIRILNEKP